jgi:hypothetical protein
MPQKIENFPLPAPGKKAMKIESYPMQVPLGKMAVKVTQQVSQILKHPTFVEGKKSRGWT